jgi:hypothetical protein
MCILAWELTTTVRRGNLYTAGIERPLRGDSIPDFILRQDVTP